MDYSSIRDNHDNGTVGEFLHENLEADSDVSIVSAYFTIYAYHHLRNKLDSINHLRFLFGEPTFIKDVDSNNENHRDYEIVDDNIVIPTESRMSQKTVAGIDTE